MRIHRILVIAVIEALQEIFTTNKYVDKVVESLLKKNKKWGKKDRGFVAETIYEIVRHKRLISEISQIKSHYNKKNIWRMFVSYQIISNGVLPPWEEFKDAPIKKIKTTYNRLQEYRAIRESIPDWIDEIGVEQLGEEWDKELTALNKQAQVVLRVNTIKTSKRILKEQLKEEGIETIEIKGYPDALILKERKNVFITEAFKKGWFEVQDASSQRVAQALDVNKKMKVIDACAGAGGKTLHIATHMMNKGSLIAMDIMEKKLFELKKRAKRNSVFNLTIKHITSSKIIKKYHNIADRLLLDVPCSGLGVLKRNPDTKWKLTPERLQELIHIQKDILERYSKMLKIGGKMVYATCSVLPCENEYQIKEFLSKHQEFKLLKEEKISPYKTGFDGFYIAVLNRAE